MAVGKDSSINFAICMTTPDMTQATLEMRSTNNITDFCSNSLTRQYFYLNFDSNDSCVYSAKLLKSYNSRKSSPNKTPQKTKLTQEKNRNLLDPTRLHPLVPNYLPDDEISVTDRGDSRPTSLTVTLTDNETSV